MRQAPLLTCAAAFLVAGLVCGGGVETALARPIEKHVPKNLLAPTRAPGTPLLAVVGLAQQRISVYDAKGKILQSPVSSGQIGYETPAGIYSIVQKEEEHHSNLYDDASMPFMERITWTGMALHAGVLPGYAASHGCVRLPHEFSQRLYDLTNMGMRVVVVREEIAPVEVPQPFMFGKSTAIEKDFNAERQYRPGVSPTRFSPSEDLLSKLRSKLSDKSIEVQSAARKVKDLRLVAAKAASESTIALRNAQGAENALARAEADVKTIEGALQKTAPEKTAPLEDAKAQALAKVSTAQTGLDAAKSIAQSKADAAEKAQADVKSAENALALALDASEEAQLNLAPVSVFISRKTMRLYVRKANMPVYEGPVMISEPNKPIGSFVFTALEPLAQGGMKWNVVSMYKDALHIEPFSKEKQAAAKGREAWPADVSAADAALARLTLPQDAIDYISQVVLPGSSLIISDEGPSIETGKDTDFVVFMSGEPQGGIAVREHRHEVARRDRGVEDWWGGSWWGGGAWDGRSSRREPRYRNQQPRAGWGGGWSGFPF